MTLEEKLNDRNNMILKGEILQPMDKYYHPDCIVIEKNDLVAKGLQGTKDRGPSVLEGVEAWLKSEIKSTAVGENVTMSEWHLEYKYKEFGHQKFDQVAVQHWKDGKIISDRFYALY